MYFLHGIRVATNNVHLSCDRQTLKLNTNSIQLIDKGIPTEAMYSISLYISTYAHVFVD